MSSISSIETITPHILSPSTAASDSTQERAWLQGEPEHSKSGKQWKGKERQTEHEYVGSGSEEDMQTGDATAYPPTNNSESETRRVEENLRRWEVAERQRRKVARESVSNAQGSPSLVGDVSRRVSQLWPERKSRHTPNSSLGTHVALQSQENIDAVPLDDINTSPTPSPISTPTPSPRRSAEGFHPDDPFANPPEESLSPFADSYRRKTSSKQDSSRTDQPMVTATRIPPPPQPLGLPPPRTPPPPRDMPPSPIFLPIPASSANSREDNKETRWWHDWLCGCSEGPDRGGEYQAGRTNPYE